MPRAKTRKKLVQFDGSKKDSRKVWQTGYKGFDKNLTCRGKKYKLHRTFVEAKADLCGTGMHFCIYPLRTLLYYPPVRQSRYAEVDALAPCQTEEYGKAVTTKLHVRTELSLRELCGAAEAMIMAQASGRKPATLDWALQKCKSMDQKAAITVDSARQSFVRTWEDKACAMNGGAYSMATTSGDYAVANCTNGYSRAYSGGHRAAAVATGTFSVARSMDYSSIAASTGKASVSVNSGPMGISVNTGDKAIARSESDFSIAGSTGDASAAVSEGDRAVSVTTKYSSDATSKGICSIAATTGICSDANVTGKQACALTMGMSAHAPATGEQATAIALGPGGRVKGARGCFLACMEWELDEPNKPMRPVGLVTAVVDGNKIKPATWYTARNGELVEPLNEEER
jgi:hypothetical protein